GVAGLYANEIADPAHIVDFLQQYDFHVSTLMRRRIAAPALSGSMLVGVRQEREIARALDRRRQLPLIRRAGPRDPARNDLAGLRDVGFQRNEILVVDLFHALSREATKLLASKITSHVAPVPFLRISLLCHYSRSISAGSSPNVASGLLKSATGRGGRSRGGRSRTADCASRSSSSSRAFAMNDGSVTAS